MTNNNQLMMTVLKILKMRIDHARTPQTKSALIFSYNLIVHALQGNEKKINEYLEREEAANDKTEKNPKGN